MTTQIDTFWTGRQKYGYTIIEAKPHETNTPFETWYTAIAEKQGAKYRIIWFTRTSRNGDGLIWGDLVEAQPIAEPSAEKTFVILGDPSGVHPMECHPIWYGSGNSPDDAWEDARLNCDDLPNNCKCYLAKTDVLNLEDFGDGEVEFAQIADGVVKITPKAFCKNLAKYKGGADD